MDNSIAKNKKLFIVIIQILVITLCIFLGYKFYTNARLEAEQWREYTSPLPDETIRDLCMKFRLSSNDPLCNGEKDIYSGDFFPAIKNTIMPPNGDWLNIEEVNSFLGDYIDEECYSLPDNPNTICYYDLRGDRVFFIWAKFDENGNLLRLTMPLEQ